MYLIFEGIDGCGKSSIVDALALYVRKLNYVPIELHEPTFGEFGRAARRMMKGESPLEQQKLHELFTLDRREHVELKIKPALEFISCNPTFILLQDRGYLSAPAYQAKRNSMVRSMLKEQMAIAPQPDLFVLIDVDVDTALDRIKHRNSPALAVEKRQVLEQVRMRYHLIADDGSVPVMTIDGRPPLKKVLESLVESLAATGVKF